MDLELKLEQKYLLRVTDTVGINEDGTDRQDILERCRLNEPVVLQHVTGHPSADPVIQIERHRGGVIGYLKGHGALAEHLDRGGEIKARIARITGRRNLLQRALGIKARGLGCFVEVSIGDFDWESARPFHEMDMEIARTLARAESNERDYPELAIKNYKKAIDLITDMDSQGLTARAWRRAGIPVNRLSMLYEKEGKPEDALELINWYLMYDDYRGIEKYDHEMILRRKKRLTPPNLQ